MIGDSEVDLRTAKAAGMPIILVSFGYATAPLHGLSPEAVIDHFDELAGHAAALLNGVRAAAHAPERLKSAKIRHNSTRPFSTKSHSQGRFS